MDAPVPFLPTLQIFKNAFNRPWTLRSWAAVLFVSALCLTCAHGAPAGSRLMRLVGSNTLGEHAVPSLAEAYLKQVKQAQNVKMTRQGEVIYVSGTLPDGSATYFEIHATGSGDCFASLLSNSPCDIGMSSRRINGQEVDAIQEKTGDMLAKRGTAPGLGNEHPVALDGIAIIVHQSNPLKRISFKELQAIFSRQKKDWKELGEWQVSGGGADGRPIVPVRRKEPSGTLDFFVQRIRPDAAVMKDPQAMGAFVTNAEVAAEVGKQPGGIGFIGQSYPLAEEVKRLQVYNDEDEAALMTPDQAVFPDTAAVQSGLYPMTRIVYFYTPTLVLNPDVRPFIQFALSDEGQSVLASEGGLIKIEGTFHQVPVPMDPVAGKTADGLAKPKDDRPKQVILRLHGSNTVGSRCAVYLAFNYLVEQRAQAGGKSPIVDLTTELKTPEGEKGMAHDVMCDLNGDGTWETIEIRPTGSSDAFRSLQHGWCDVGMSSRQISDAERRDLMTVCGDLRLPGAQFALGLDALAVIVNPANKVEKLTLDQVAQIYLGGLTDWSAVGGAAGLMNLNTRPERSGSYRFFCDSVLHGRTVIDSAARHAENTLVTGAVAADPLGIGFVPMSMTDKTRPLSIGHGGTEDFYQPSAETVRSGQYSAALCRYVYFYVPENKPEGFTAESRLNWETARRFALQSQTWRGQAITTNCGFVPGIAILDQEGQLRQAEGETPLAYVERLAALERKIESGKLVLHPALTDNAVCPRLLFNTNQFSLTAESQNAIDLKLASWLKLYPASVRSGFIVEGWSDSIGTDESCLEISAQRAQVVASQLRSSLGLKVTTVGKGKSFFPPNTSEENKQINRRAVIRLASPPAQEKEPVKGAAKAPGRKKR
jgi:phosphate transport system substrate-binding protein